MNITVIFFTNRPGCIDLMASALAAQQWDKDKFTWELVVVDGYPGRVDRGHAEVYVVSLGVPLRSYVPPKSKTFPWSRTGFANAMNTGLLLAGGTHVVFLHDYTSLPSDALERWYAAFTDYPNHLITGIAQEIQAPKPESPEDVMTWTDGDATMRAGRMWIPDDFEVGYWGGPISFFDDGNGIDERADFCSHYALHAVKAQAKLLGYNLLVDHSLLCYMIDHREWDEGPWSSPVNSQWRMKGVYSDVPQEPVWGAWAANPYCLKSERMKNAVLLDLPIRLHPRFYVSNTPDTPKVAERG